MDPTTPERRGRPRERGNLLLVAVILIVLVGGLTAAASTLARNDRSGATQKLARIRAAYAAESATQYAVKLVQDRAAAGAPFATATTGSVRIQGELVPWSIEPLGATVVRTSPDGVQESLDTYRIRAKASSRASGTTTPSLTDVVVDRAVVVGTIPIFQFAVFYGVALEIDPGQNMDLNGRVQSNGDLWISPLATLDLHSGWVRAAGSVYRTRGDLLFQAGAVNVQVNGAPPGTLLPWPTDSTHTQNTSADPGFSSWIQQFAAPGSVSTLADKDTGGSALTVPSFQSAAPGGYYDHNAALTIRPDPVTGNPRAFQGGTDVTAALPANTLTQSRFWDQRAGAQVTVTDVDVGLLRQSACYPGAGAGNGLIYAVRDDATPARPNGIRLKNASDISARTNDNGRGVTVVSPDPVYLLGDFNHPATAANERPAAVLADAVYLLSNSWQDSQNQTRRTSGNGPAAASTVYDLAFAAGNTASTGPGGYGGGLENLPRFLEDWSGGKVCTITGSLVCFQPAQVATSLWSGAAGSQPCVYSPPVRVWSFDTRFLTPSRLPPFTPKAVRIVQNVSWVAQ